jgi:hypothetical protein
MNTIEKLLLALAAAGFAITSTLSMRVPAVGPPSQPSALPWLAVPK